MGIQDKVCYVVINADTMERISKFYSRKSDAKAFLTRRKRYWTNLEYAIAEFVYQTHYKLEETC